MPFSLAEKKYHPDRNSRWLLQTWLLSVLLLVYLLIFVGGITRLTGSGLSITEWQPLRGILPPLTQPHWVEAFRSYQQTHEFQHVNQGMNLGEFKTIYWWEWSHRFLARISGASLLIPFLIFLASGRLNGKLSLKILGIIFLFTLQGGVGWWMVTSGLWSAANVSHIRLSIHLALASLIVLAIAALISGLAPRTESPPGRSAQLLSGSFLFFLWIQIILGGLVAGLHAGKMFNTWPLLDNHLIPDGLLFLSPAWRNLLENPKAILFLHRLLPYVLCITAAVNAALQWKKRPGSRYACHCAALLFLLLLQFCLGVSSVLWHSPGALAIAHQSLAVILVGLASAHYFRMQ